MLTELLHGSNLSIVLNEHFKEDGALVFNAACQLGCEGIVSKRLGSIYRSGARRRSEHTSPNLDIYAFGGTLR